MSLAKPIILALGKKLKRRSLPRWQWREVQQATRQWKTGEQRQTSTHYAKILRRHAPMLYGNDPLALRAAYVERFAPGGRVDAARHMVRRANGLEGLQAYYPRVGIEMAVCNYIPWDVFRRLESAHG